MRQGQIESDDDYLIRFKAKAKSLELFGGELIFFSFQILKKSLDQVIKNKIKKRTIPSYVLLSMSR